MTGISILISMYILLYINKDSQKNDLLLITTYY